MSLTDRDDIQHGLPHSVGTSDITHASVPRFGDDFLKSTMYNSPKVPQVKDEAQEPASKKRRTENLLGLTPAGEDNEEEIDEEEAVTNLANP